MNEDFVRWAITTLVVFAWSGTSAFIVSFHFGTPDWHKTPVGRTHMHRAASMWLFLTFVMMSRLLEPLPIVLDSLRLVIYFAVGLLEWRLWAVLRHIQKGKITLANPQYTPIKDWWGKHVTSKKRSSR